MTVWMEEALCRQVDPELFFPEAGAPNLKAIQICRQCPVQTQCLETALANGELYGVWGGTSASDRRALSRGVPPRSWECRKGHDIRVLGRTDSGRCVACVQAYKRPRGRAA